MTDNNVELFQRLLRVIHDPTETLAARTQAFYEARPFIDDVAQRVARCVVGEEQMTEQELEVADMLLRRFPDFAAVSLGMHEDPEVRRYQMAGLRERADAIFAEIDARQAILH